MTSQERQFKFDQSQFNAAFTHTGLTTRYWMKLV